MEESVAGLRLLRLSLAVEAILGAMVILLAAFLASDVPGTHETPIWPFSRQPSLELLFDPDIRGLLLDASLPIFICGACTLVGWFWRPAFWPSLAGFVITLVLSTGKLASLLTVEAYPTTFAISPTEFANSSIVHGAALFAANCATCHGASAQGDGPAAKSLPVLPADLTAPHFGRTPRAICSGSSPAGWRRRPAHWRCRLSTAGCPPATVGR